MVGVRRPLLGIIVCVESNPRPASRWSTYVGLLFIESARRARGARRKSYLTTGVFMAQTLIYSTHLVVGPPRGKVKTSRSSVIHVIKGVFLVYLVTMDVMVMHSIFSRIVSVFVSHGENNP